MKAFVVSAGLGTRLRPLTNTVPKCMIDIGGRPLLWYHVMQLKYHGINDIWINTHWLADQVTSYFGDGSEFGVGISYSHEKELLGTSGALTNPDSKIHQSFSGEKEFLVIYGDNFTNFNYSNFLSFSRSKNCIMCIAVNHSEEPWTKGVIEVDSDSKIISVVEKPPKEDVKSDLTNAGIYFCTPPVLDATPVGFSDFATDIIPKLMVSHSMYAYVMDEYLQDTGTPERYAKAQSDLPNVKFPFQSK